jgi:hypothetical protein
VEPADYACYAGISGFAPAGKSTAKAASRLSTDSACNYRALKGSVHVFVNHTQKE